MNHISTRVFALSTFLVTACSGTIDIGNNDDEMSTGGTGTSGGAGGAQNSNGGTHSDTGGSSSGETVAVDDLRKGGYAGGFSVVGPDGQEQDGNQLTQACVNSGGYAYSTWIFSEGECSGGSLCTDSCTSTAECPSLEGASKPLCLADDGAPSSQHCVNLCDSNSDCPQGMICERPGFSSFEGRICLIADTAWAPGCDGFCMDQEAHEYFKVDCESDDDCCAGLVCAPEGNCE